LICEVCDVRCETCTGVYFNCEECKANSLRNSPPECPCDDGYYDPCGENTFEYAIGTTDG
jgi:hypothetical protein